MRQHYLKKWLKSPGMDSFDVRDIIDWGYYKERLGKTIQKIITIPAALQLVPNPVPRVAHPDWLQRKVREESSRHSQQKITAMFKRLPAPNKDKENSPNSVLTPRVTDLEDIGGGGRAGGAKRPLAHKFKQVVSRRGGALGLGCGGKERWGCELLGAHKEVRVREGSGWRLGD